MRDLDALRVFEDPRPKSGHKFGAIQSLLQDGVPVVGVRALINKAPWPEENKQKWRGQLVKIAQKTIACPFCTTEGHEDGCPVAKYMAKPDGLDLDPYEAVDARSCRDVFDFACKVSAARPGV